MLILRLDLYIVLFSQLTHLVQVFPSPFISDEETNFVSVPDPFVIDAPLMMHIPSNGRDTVQFSTFLLKEVGHTPLHTKSLHEPDLAVIKLFWMDSKLAIHESVFQGPQGDPDEPDLVCESRVLRLHRRYNQPSRPIPDDDFIVDDWDEPEMQQEFVHPRTDRAVPISMEEDWQWTLDFSDVYAMAIGQIEIPQKTSKATKRQKPKARTFDGFISDLEREMKNLSTKQTLSETMVELSDKTLLTEDLDKCTDEVKRLFSAIMPKDPDPDARHRFLLLPLQYQTVTYGIPSRLPGEADRDMLNIYDRMVDDWVSTLSRDIPVPLRLAKEKLIRKIAADLLLSHLVKITTSLDRVILPKPADPIMDQNEKSTTQNKYLQSSFFSQSNYHIPASQSQMTNGSLGSQRNPTPKPAPSKYSAVPVFDGLSAFTTFKKPRATAENVSNVLSHWSVGNNPSTYIWERIEDEETRRSASQTPKRKKKRLQARDQPLPPTPLVPMVRSWGTQPLTPQINVSSQPDVSMTQTERGIFGARELKKKKKKKRMAGF
jgi:RNA polymerase I-specific transcription initiation factor RRN6